MPDRLERLLIVSAALAALATASVTPPGHWGSIKDQAQLSSALSVYSAQSTSPVAAASAYKSILRNIVPSARPTSIPQAEQELLEIFKNNPTDAGQSTADILLSGLAGGDLAEIYASYAFYSSSHNHNPKSPATPIYPQADSNDAPYSVSEESLRAAMYIPPSFTYGKIPAVILVPGTAGVAGQQFGPTYGRLFEESKVADPVYLNVPGLQLNDLQVNSEYVAYAVNYISGISGGKNVTTIGWSQGTTDTQWAFKYWPSTRKHIAAAINLSPAFHGTVVSDASCPGYITESSTPAACQLTYNSTFINTLRANAGSSAIVPTTNVYSIFDEVVEPQQNPNASGYLGDANGIQVTNVQVQDVCPASTPAGGPYVDHEGILYNALAYALAVDSITHGGVALVERINTTYICNQYATPGLSLNDVEATEALLPIASYNIYEYQPKVAHEPPIMPYAQMV